MATHARQETRGRRTSIERWGGTASRSIQALFTRKHAKALSEDKTLERKLKGKICVVGCRIIMFYTFFALSMILGWSSLRLPGEYWLNSYLMDNLLEEPFDQETMYTFQDIGNTEDMTSWMSAILPEFLPAENVTQPNIFDERNWLLRFKLRVHSVDPATPRLQYTSTNAYAAENMYSVPMPNEVESETAAGRTYFPVGRIVSSSISHMAI